MFKNILGFVLAFGLAGGAFAATATTPEQALRTTTEQLQASIKAHYTEFRADSTKFYKFVDDSVVPRFDVPYIAQLVLGLNYRTASADQRTRFAEAFKNMLVRSYANAMLDNYDSVNIQWLPVRLAPGATDAVVNTTMARDVGKPYAIGFRVHAVNDDWKVYDISVENISLVTNFKTQLNSEIKKSSLDDVIHRMESGEFLHDGGGDDHGHASKKAG